MFIKVCKQNDFWPFLDQREKYPTIFKQLEMPTVSKRCIEKYKEEIEQGKELLLFKSEQVRVSPFLPLCVFPNLDVLA